MPDASPDHRPSASGTDGSGAGCAALVLSRDSALVELIRGRVSGIATRFDQTDTAEDVLRVTRGLWYDVVIVDAALGEEGLAACEGLRSVEGGPASVLYAERASLELATSAMRSGAFDLLSKATTEAEFADRIARAVRESASRRRSAEREARLKRLCSKLDRARREVTGQVGELCTDLAGAYQDLSDQIGELAMSGELNGLLRQELDIESLLRTFLEYLLAQVGSTNAGVFLPNSVGDYTLGAYINYDRPKATAEAGLDEVAGVLGPAFEDDRTVVKLSRAPQIRERLGEFESCFEGQTVLAVGCFDGDDVEASECLAVLCLFRDRRTPFSVRAERTVQIASELFGRQMARVIRVHHRCGDDELWGSEEPLDGPADGFDDGLGDDIGRAA
jgi:FixJ family two-component response regulator